MRSMNNINKVVKLKGPRHIEVVEEPVPEPLEGEVLLKVLYCGLCRTDAKMWDTGHRDLILPRVLGHEFCGEVEGEEGIFVVWPAKSCGNCSYCSNNRENLCENIKILGFHLDGGLARFVRVPEDSLIKLPEVSDPFVFTLAEPVACCLNCVDGFVSPEDEVLILGSGIMGNLLSLCCREICSRVYVYDVDEKRLERVKWLRDKAGVEVFEPGRNKRFDVVINANSSWDSFEKGILFLKKGGKFCFFSGITEKRKDIVSVLNEIHYKELMLKGSYGCRKDQIQRAVYFISKRENTLVELVDDIISLEEVEEGILRILNKECLKLVVKV